jgi:hypothetical protein
MDRGHDLQRDQWQRKKAAQQLRRVERAAPAAEIDAALGGAALRPGAQRRAIAVAVIGFPETVERGAVDAEQRRLPVGRRQTRRHRPRRFRDRKAGSQPVPITATRILSSPWHCQLCESGSGSFKSATAGFPARKSIPTARRRGKPCEIFVRFCRSGILAMSLQGR